MVEILVVDDDDISREILKAVLSQAGYEIKEASQGEEALQSLDNGCSKPDIIILDRYMPQMDGMEFVGRVKAKEEFRNIKVIMLTGGDSHQEITEASQMDIFYHMTKPLKKEVLLSVVDAAIEGVDNDDCGLF